MTENSKIEEITEEEILCELKQSVRAAKSLAAWARDNDVDEGQVRAMIKERWPMAPKIGAALGYRRIAKWVKLESRKK